MCSVRSVSPPMPYMICRWPGAGLGVRNDGLDQEGEVLERLPLEAEVVQRLEHETGVADPRVPVVPVALAAGRLGQRRGAGGHDRARGCVAERLQRQRAALDERPVRVVGDRRPRQPVAPVLLGAGELRHRLVLGGGTVALPRQRQPRGFALLERRAPVGAGAEDAEAHAPGQVEREVPGAHGGPLVAAVDVGPLTAVDAVVELRDAVGLYLDPAAGAGRDPEQRALRHRVSGHPAVAVPAFVGRGGADDEQVPDDEPPGRCVPRGLEHVGAGDVTPLVGNIGAGRTEPEEAGGAVEQRAEHARRVRPRQAEPLDRSVGRHERAHLAVGEERVIRDVRERGHAGLLIGVILARPNAGPPLGRRSARR